MKYTEAIVVKQSLDQVVNYDPESDLYLLDYLDELDNADEYAELPYACRAGSCSACAGKVRRT